MPRTTALRTTTLKTTALRTTALKALGLGLMVAACGAPVSAPNHSAQPAPTEPAAASVSPRCGKEGKLVLQVLGSGGPIADDARASSGYLLWRDGKARVLVDVGGGVFLRFGEAGAAIADLEAIAMTHLHADHVGDLPALLKSGYFSGRKRPLPVFGPDGNARFPAMDVFVNRLLDPKQGAFAYLSGYLDGSLFPLSVSALPADAAVPSTIHDQDGMVIEAIGVKHGQIPAVGYVITIGNKRIAFAGDQRADNTPFIKMAHDADILVMHHAIPEKGFDAAKHLHGVPSDIGRAASVSRAKHLVLSHHMQRALADSDGALAAIRKSYAGPVSMAADLDCFSLVP